MREAGLLQNHPWVRRWKLDVDAYHRMGEAGILTEDDRVELIEGELVEMTPIGSGHAGTVIGLSQVLFQTVAGRAFVSVQNPIRLDEHNEPQPDFALLLPRPGNYKDALPIPADLLLLIEVADTSLRFDRAVRAPLYARHGVRELWIVDIAGDIVEVLRGPGPQGYAQTMRAVRGDVLEPEALPGLRITVADVLA